MCVLGLVYCFVGHASIHTDKDMIRNTQHNIDMWMSS